MSQENLPVSAPRPSGYAAFLHILYPSHQSVVLLFLICQIAPNGWAQAYPAKVVRLIVPFTAGSGVDTAARIIAGGLTEVFGQQVLVDNRGGAAGNIGLELAMRAPADGYTLVIKSEVEKLGRVIRRLNLTAK